MKKPLLFLGLIFSSITGFLNAQGALTPEVLYYKFNGSGTTVPNEASAPPPGTATANIMGGVTQGGSGTLCAGTLIGTGAASSTDYLNTNWAPNIGIGAWTISVRTSGISTNTTLYYIFGDVGTNSFRCFTNGVAGSTNWIIRGAGLTDLYINGGALSTPTMITFVYDPTLGNLKGYLNGVLVSTVAQGAVNLTGTGPLKVMGYSTNVGAPAGGLIDEFRLYNHALTAAEVMELYNPFATPFLGADQYSCPGDTTELGLIYPTTTVAWNTGSTADTTFIPGPGTYIATVTGACGSGADTIDFISSASSSSMSPTSCGAYTAPSGTVFSTTGSYTDTITNYLGCDSLITIGLTVLDPSASSLSPTVCGTTYTSPSGNSYSTSGMYMDTIPNMAGCDSVITINLTVGNNSSTSISPNVCGSSYTTPSGILLSSSGTYNDTILNSSGCDSIITINLTLNTVNTNVTQSGSNGEMLMAAGTGTYSWIDCGTMTPVGVTTSMFTATANGSYAVVIDNGGCVDTSSCFIVAGLGVDNNTLAELVKLYPNPTTGQFYISVGAINQTFTLELINNVGQVLQSSLFTNTNIGTMEINGTAGLYFVRITKSNGEKAVLRVIKD